MNIYHDSTNYLYYIHRLKVSGSSQLKWLTLA